MTGCASHARLARTPALDASAPLRRARRDMKELGWEPLVRAAHLRAMRAHGVDSCDTKSPFPVKVLCVARTKNPHAYADAHRVVDARRRATDAAQADHGAMVHMRASRLDTMQSRRWLARTSVRSRSPRMTEVALGPSWANMRFIEPLDAKLEVARMQPTIITDEDIAILAGVAELLAAPGYQPVGALWNMPVPGTAWADDRHHV